MKEKIILKSLNPNEYPDLEIECKVIENSKIGEYIESIPPERKFHAFKTGKVIAEIGKPGEVIKTEIKTTIDGKEYILFEMKNTVKERTFKDKQTKDGKEMEIERTKPDVVITNISSTSKERYVTSYENFVKNYAVGEYGTYIPLYELRELAVVDENLRIETSWGERVTCLKGSCIVTYNAEKNDYNAVEKEAVASTYTTKTEYAKKLMRD